MNSTSENGKGRFSLLWNSILDSSIWDQAAATRVVWITLLAMKDQDGFVRAAFSGLKRNANVTEEECRKALEIFMSPDPESASKKDEGRRIREVDGGWYIINHEKYQYSSEEKREYWRIKKAEERAKKAKIQKQRRNVKKGLPLPGEGLLRNGADSGEIADMVNSEKESNRKEQDEYDPA